MQVILSGRGVLLTPAFKAVVEKKVARLGRALPPIRDARLVCTAEKFRRTVRLTVRTARRSFSSEATATDLGAAADAALEAVRRQCRESLGRLRPRKARTPAAPARPAEPAVAEGPTPRRLVAKPMSVEEAMLQLDLRGDQFLVFRNARTNEVNVLYRGRNGGLRLIEPVA